ncbi:MAG: hypothetical protein ACJ73S_20405 [Mycobacteriales bacterium]
MSSHQPTNPRPEEGRKTTKISVTMPKEVVEEVRQRADGNVSRWITKAVEREIDRAIRNERLGEWIEEVMKDEEPFTDEERAWVKAQWDDE